MSSWIAVLSIWSPLSQILKLCMPSISPLLMAVRENHFAGDPVSIATAPLGKVGAIGRSKLLCPRMPQHQQHSNIVLAVWTH
jgi:hypothetical protein